MTDNKKISRKRVLKYLFFVVVICWIGISIPLFINYIRNSSQEVVSKWGTFVEGIFNTTSYLPYLNNDPQSLFYQGLLFRPCLNYDIDTQGNITYKTEEAEKNNLCNVDTQDHKTYRVSLRTEKKNTWSDGVPFSLEDILFTYKEIIINNKFNLKHLESYKNIEISQEANRIKVVFPEKNRDNTLFFTHYLLPKHALLEPNIDMYKQSFALEPIYNNCARIYAQSTDQYSLVFDLSACEDTNIGFYQIKNNTTFDTFKKKVQEKSSIIDIYADEYNNPNSKYTALSGYKNHMIMTDKYLTLFFNTESDKLLVRTRRALGGLIAHKIYNNTWIQFFSPYTNPLFNQHFSKGENIQDFLNTIGEKRNEISSKDIIDSGVKEFPEDGKLKLTSTNGVYTYYMKKNSKNFQKTTKTAHITLDQKYDKIGIHYWNTWDNKGLYYPKSRNKKTMTFDYNISVHHDNLKVGMNTYTIYGFYLKNKKSKLATIQIYVLDEKNPNKTDKENTNNWNTTKASLAKIKIIWLNTKINRNTSNLLKVIFAQKKILEYFSFELFDDEDKLQGIVTAGNYDIYLWSINASLQQWFYNFLNTENKTHNPSQYNNQKINLLLRQRNEKNTTTVQKEINTIYSKDVPFVVLGKEYNTIFAKPEIWDKLTEKNTMHEYNRRKKIYKNLVITKNIYRNPEALLDIKKFYHYISNLHTSK